MREASLEVYPLLWVLELDRVERTIRSFPGVLEVAVDVVHGRAQVRFDEGEATAGGLQRQVQDCYFHCIGRRAPRHVCVTPLA